MRVSKASSGSTRPRRHPRAAHSGRTRHPRPPRVARCRCAGRLPRPARHSSGKRLWGDHSRSVESGIELATQGGQGCRASGRGLRRLSPSSPRTRNHRRQDPAGRSVGRRAGSRRELRDGYLPGCLYRAHPQPARRVGQRCCHKEKAGHRARLFPTVASRVREIKQPGCCSPACPSGPSSLRTRPSGLPSMS